MSAYAHQMEREFSAQTLSSRGNSEMGSRYLVESGFYMTSFVATIFIASLVTVGVLLVTLVVTLGIMLQSCENRSHGIVETQVSDVYYDHCKSFAQHAELNSLEADEFPIGCKSYAIQYVEKGDYIKDLNFTLQMIETYFSSITPSDDGTDVVLMDIDDIFPSDACFSSRLMYQLGEDRCNGCIEYAQDLKHTRILQLFLKIQSRGWPWILITRKPDSLHNITFEHLSSAGYSGWSSLIMRSDNETQMDSSEYFSRQREIMQKDGLGIVAVLSSEMDAITGVRLGKRAFKFPTIARYLVQTHFESHRRAY